MIFDEAGRALRCEAERAREERRAAHDLRVLRALQASGTTRAALLAGEVGEVTATVQGALERLSVAGLAVRAGAGRWRAAPTEPGLVVVPAADLADLRARLERIEGMLAALVGG